MIDINLVRSLGTLFAFLAFIGLCFWAYSPKRKQAFHEAEMLPFEDDHNPQAKKQTKHSDKLGAQFND